MEKMIDGEMLNVPEHVASFWTATDVGQRNVLCREITAICRAPRQLKICAE